MTENTQVLLDIALDKNTSIPERCSAAYRLAQAGELQKGVSLLYKLARNARTFETEWHALSAVDFLADLGKYDDLERLSLTEENSNVIRGRAIQMLAVHAETSRLVKIAWQLQRGKDIGTYLARYLHQLGCMNVLDALSRERSANEFLQKEYAEILTENGNTDAAFEIWRNIVATENTHPWIRAKAAKQVLDAGYPDEAANAYNAVAYDDHWEFSDRCYAIRKLIAMGRDSEARDAYLNLAQDQSLDSYDLHKVVLAVSHLDLFAGLLPLIRDNRIATETRLDALQRLLGMKEDPKFSEALVAILRDKDVDPSIRVTVSNFLKGLKKSRKYLAAYVQLACDERVPRQDRKQIFAVLERSAKFAGLLDLKVVALDKNIGIWARLKIIRVLQQMGKTSDAYAAWTTIGKDVSLALRIRKIAACLLAEAQQLNDAVDILLEIIHNEAVSDVVRADSAFELNYLGFYELVSSVLAEIARKEDTILKTRLRAAQILVANKPAEEFKAILFQIAVDNKQDPEMRLEALISLPMLDEEPKVIELMLELFDNSLIESMNRFNLVDPLLQFGYVDRVTSGLLSMALAPGTNVATRLGCVQILIDDLQKVSEAIPILLLVAMDENVFWLRRRRAVDLLAIYGDKDAIPHLQRLLATDQLESENVTGSHKVRSSHLRKSVERALRQIKKRTGGTENSSGRKKEEELSSDLSA